MNQLSQLVKTKRAATTYTQNSLSKALGYKNGQFISNIERGLCGIPLPKAKRLMELINIDEREFKLILMIDFENKIDKAIS